MARKKWLEERSQRYNANTVAVEKKAEATPERKRGFCEQLTPIPMDKRPLEYRKYCIASMHEEFVRASGGEASGAGLEESGVPGVPGVPEEESEESGVSEESRDLGDSEHSEESEESQRPELPQRTDNPEDSEDSAEPNAPEEPEDPEETETGTVGGSSSLAPSEPCTNSAYGSCIDENDQKNEETKGVKPKIRGLSRLLNLFKNARDKGKSRIPVPATLALDNMQQAGTMRLASLNQGRHQARNLGIRQDDGRNTFPPSRSSSLRPAIPLQWRQSSSATGATRASAAASTPSAPHTPPVKPRPSPPTRLPTSSSSGSSKDSSPRAYVPTRSSSATSQPPQRRSFTCPPLPSCSPLHLKPAPQTHRPASPARFAPFPLSSDVAAILSKIDRDTQEMRERERAANLPLPPSPNTSSSISPLTSGPSQAKSSPPSSFLAPASAPAPALKYPHIVAAARSFDDDLTRMCGQRLDDVAATAKDRSMAEIREDRNRGGHSAGGGGGCSRGNGEQLIAARKLPRASHSTSSSHGHQACNMPLGAQRNPAFPSPAKKPESNHTVHSADNRSDDRLSTRACSPASSASTAALIQGLADALGKLDNTAERKSVAPDGNVVEEQDEDKHEEDEPVKPVLDKGKQRAVTPDGYEEQGVVAAQQQLEGDEEDCSFF
ncbi:hypothetical protein BDV95DRAFT_556221 [Massariosphaeria phaeospora]|uniref:Uncharacterized protein n=1 Tax=Massariosphaeria phaeospora TaxID=100035 RepID=A0A7C8MGQ8_9PLEO|nr:hypothetical protein BDV95DRAFT_556221 [Massariosphaeria phaeospora]